MFFLITKEWFDRNHGCADTKKNKNGCQCCPHLRNFLGSEHIFGLLQDYIWNFVKLYKAIARKPRKVAG